MEYYKGYDPNSKQAKYLKAKMEGKNKSQAEKEAYGKVNNNTTRIEKSKSYKSAEAFMSGFLVSPEEIAGEMNKVIKQDDDRPSKMNAIKEANKIHNVYPKDENVVETGDVKITIRKND